MDHREIIEATIAYVKDILKDAEPGHDWWHINRVWDMSKHLAKSYKTDPLVINFGALLHDIGDSKFHDGNEKTGPKTANVFLENFRIDQEKKKKIIEIIKCLSFKNHEAKQPDFIEFKIIQDADRLDAMGAIGIARAFSYGGYRKREMYNPGIKPFQKFDKEQYKRSNSPTLNHFYEKLLLLKDMLNTKEAKQIALKRHDFMLQFLKEFKHEWSIGS